MFAPVDRDVHVTSVRPPAENGSEGCWRCAVARWRDEGNCPDHRDAWGLWRGWTGGL